MAAEATLVSLNLIVEEAEPRIEGLGLQPSVRGDLEDAVLAAVRKLVCHRPTVEVKLDSVGYVELHANRHFTRCLICSRWLYVGDESFEGVSRGMWDDGYFYCSWHLSKDQPR